MNYLIYEQKGYFISLLINQSYIVLVDIIFYKYP